MSGPSSGKPPSLSLEELTRPFAASLGIWSAWAEAWGSLVTKRGAPAVQTVLERLVAFDPLAPEKSWPALSEMLEELRGVLGFPVFADLPAIDAAPLSMAPMMELAAVAQQYLTAIAAIWPRLIQRFQSEMEQRRQEGIPLDSAGRAMDVWNNVVDRTLMEFNRSMDFGALQQRFLRALMRQRQEVRKLAEKAAQALDMPTRTEMEDVYRRLHDLTREVDALRHEVRELRRERAQITTADDQGRR